MVLDLIKIKLPRESLLICLEMLKYPTMCCKGAWIWNGTGSRGITNLCRVEELCGSVKALLCRFVRIAAEIGRSSSSHPGLAKLARRGQSWRAVAAQQLVVLVRPQSLKKKHFEIFSLNFGEFLRRDTNTTGGMCPSAVGSKCFSHPFPDCPWGREASIRTCSYPEVGDRNRK